MFKIFKLAKGTRGVLSFKVVINLVLVLLYWFSFSNLAISAEIAVLDINKAIHGTKYYQRFIKQSRPELDRLESKIKAAQDALRGDYDKYKKNEPTYSSAVKEKEQNRILKKEEDYRKLLGELETFQRDKSAEISQQLKPKLDAVIKEIVERKKFRIVLNKEGIVIFSLVEDDITDEVKEKLDKLYDSEG